MGCGRSKSSVPWQPYPVERYQYVQSFLTGKCHLSVQDLSELYNAFRKISPKATEDRVTFEAYCKYLYFEKRGRFLKTMILYFSADHETLSFPQFALHMSVFSTLNEEALAELLYVMITDGDYVSSTIGNVETAVITVSSMEQVIKQLFGNAWGNEAKITKILRHMEGNGTGPGVVTSHLFKKYCVSNRSLLHMPVTLQLALRGKIISEAFWHDRECSGVRSPSVGDVPELRRELLALESGT